MTSTGHRLSFEDLTTLWDVRRRMLSDAGDTKGLHDLEKEIRDYGKGAASDSIVINAGRRTVKFGDFEIPYDPDTYPQIATYDGRAFLEFAARFEIPTGRQVRSTLL